MGRGETACARWLGASKARGAARRAALDPAPRPHRSGQPSWARDSRGEREAARRAAGKQLPSCAKPAAVPGIAVAAQLKSSAELFVLDAITLCWTQVARTPPLPREAGTLVGLGDKFLLAFGGWSGSYSPADARQSPWSDALHALHLPTQRWFELAAPGPAPTGRYGHAAAVVDTAPTHAAHCSMHGDGLRKALAGVPAELMITARDARGGARWSGGDAFQARRPVTASHLGSAPGRCPCSLRASGEAARHWRSE